MKKYLTIALLSLGWYVFWLYTNIAGTISCMSDGYWLSTKLIRFLRQHKSAKASDELV